MKYFAILKDSLREALDSKVLYVLLGLSLLMILFVATLSFKPLAAEKTLEQVVDGSTGAILEALKPDTDERGRRKKQGDAQFGKNGELPFAMGGSDYRLEKATVLRGTPDSPDADYLITLSKQFFNEAAADKVRANPEAELQAVRKHFARLEERNYCRIGDVRVSTEASSKPFNVDFHVEFLPTSAMRRLWLHEPSLFFGLVPLSEVDVPLGFQLFLIAQFVLSMGSWIAVLLSVIITAFFIPNMLQKGSVDLLLVKPVSRSLLLLFKFVGGLTLILLVNIFAVSGIWLALGLRSGVWANWMLLLIPIFSFFFAILYSVSTLIAVLTRSIVAAILITIGAWFLFFIVGFVNGQLEGAVHREERAKLPAEERSYTNSTLRSIVSAVHRALPRTSDLNELSALLVFSDFIAGGYLSPERALSGERNWWESFGVSSAFIAVMLGLSCWRFARKDY